MMMQMLEAGGLATLSDHFRTPDVNNPLGYYEFERVKKLREGDVHWLPEAQGRVVKVISALLQHLPAEFHYQVIFMNRNLNEVLLSQQKMLKALGEPTNQHSQEELHMQYQAHLQAVINWLKQQPNFDVLYLDHHDVLRDTNTYATEIEDFLQLGLDIRAMSLAVDSSLYRNRLQPLAENEPKSTT